VEDKGGILR
jgi:ATP-dependent Clp protease ATP-binding subunit ClpB